MTANVKKTARRSKKAAQNPAPEYTGDLPEGMPVVTTAALKTAVKGASNKTQTAQQSLCAIMCAWAAQHGGEDLTVEHIGSLVGFDMKKPKGFDSVEWARGKTARETFRDACKKIIPIAEYVRYAYAHGLNTVGFSHKGLLEITQKSVDKSAREGNLEIVGQGKASIRVVSAFCRREMDTLLGRAPKDGATGKPRDKYATALDSVAAKAVATDEAGENMRDDLADLSVNKIADHVLEYWAESLTPEYFIQHRKALVRFGKAIAMMRKAVDGDAVEAATPAAKGTAETKRAA